MIQNLCKDIETAVGRQLKSPKDFEMLKERIYARQRVLISRTTLMRIWGYIDEPVKPRANTLDILARFIGYHDWKQYQENAGLQKDQQSSPVMTRRLSVNSELRLGDRLRLSWQPGRVCDVEYLDNLSFRVIASKNTRLQAGNTFQCSLIIEGEPLFLDNLQQANSIPTAAPIAYVCGKKTGVHFEFL